MGRTKDYAAIRPPTSAVGTGEVASHVNQELLNGQVVGIYTLTESAGDRARKMLQEMFDGVDVEVNNDLVGSAKLKALSRRADWFIVATRSAKHAATEFIKEARPQGKKELLYPLGKGASSIVSVLLKALCTG